MIPVDYENGKGITRRMLVDQIGVTDGQNDLTKKITFEGANVRIRIGDEDITFPPGTKKTYVIRYRCRGMMNWFEKERGLGADGTAVLEPHGDQWDTSMARVTATATFPTADGDAGLRAKDLLWPVRLSDETNS